MTKLQRRRGGDGIGG